MLKIEIVNSKISSVKDFDKELVIVETIEEVFHDFDVTVSMKTTLSSKKGSIHWHLKKGNAKGVLEVTYWQQKDQLWLEIHDNRRAQWNEEMIVEMAKALTEALN